MIAEPDNFSHGQSPCPGAGCYLFGPGQSEDAPHSHNFDGFPQPHRRSVKSGDNSQAHGNTKLSASRNRHVSVEVALEPSAERTFFCRASAVKRLQIKIARARCCASSSNSTATIFPSFDVTRDDVKVIGVMGERS